MFKSTSPICLGLLLSLAVFSVKAEINNNKPPLSLTLEQVKSWSLDPLLRDSRYRSYQPVQERFQAETTLGKSSTVRVLIAPDGMNNLGNYNEELNKFNLYNFTHWSNIDILSWFAGTANETVSIPARPWVDTAHRNGVKVLGSIFLAVNQYGGSIDTVKSFLQRDAEGNFPVAEELISIAQFYNFDGWLMNQETDLTLRKDENGEVVKGSHDFETGKFLASEMKAFMKYLTEIAPKHMEIHWYDAMVPDGQVKWQNMLNDQNSPYFQDGKDKISDAVFLNYWWNEVMALQSYKNVMALGRSVYDVYFGVDLWPARNAQRIFSSSKWLHAIFPEDNTEGLGSIALFGNNANFNFSGTKNIKPLSTFQANKEDYDSFYEAETRLFAGDDLNLATNNQGQTWEGIAHFVKPKSTLDSLPFVTSFNTGHGLNKFRQGKVAGGEWHDVAKQDILPTWQFAVIGNEGVKLKYDFKDAFSGGSSLAILGDLSNGESKIPLYSAKFTLSENSTLEVVHKQNTTKDVLSLWLKTASGESIELALDGKDSDWVYQTFKLGEHQGKSILSIGFKTNSEKVMDFKANIGFVSLK